MWYPVWSSWISVLKVDWKIVHFSFFGVSANVTWPRVSALDIKKLIFILKCVIESKPPRKKKQNKPRVRKERSLLFPWLRLANGVRVVLFQWCPGAVPPITPSSFSKEDGIQRHKLIYAGSYRPRQVCWLWAMVKDWKHFHGQEIKRPQWNFLVT